MKDNPQRWRTPRLATLAALLPLALGSTAQNPPPVQSAMPLPTVVTPSVARAPVVRVPADPGRAGREDQRRRADALKPAGERP